jgi:hypothetical protein
VLGLLLLDFIEVVEIIGEDHIDVDEVYEGGGEDKFADLYRDVGCEGEAVSYL